LESIKDWLLAQGLEEPYTTYVIWSVKAVLVLLAAWVSHFVTRRVVLSIVRVLVRRSKTNWDDFLLERRFFSRLAHITPALVISGTAYLFADAQAAIERFAMVYMFLAGLGVFFAFLSALEDIYGTYQISKNRPVRGYVQLVKIIVAVFVILVAVSTLMDRSPLILLSGLGAMTAVLLLIFKDSILGLVASIQISMNDMVRIGDWIEMPKFGADGDVIDITLHTVKVQNWDKTITTIPAYALISDSFKNWRGMSESGGRRIKRSISIDMSSIKFCDEEMLDRYQKYQLITDYVKSRRTEVTADNESRKIDTSELINGRRLTNIGTFRAYLGEYLRQNKDITQEMTFLMRQLQPTENGLPLEIYVFSADKDWINYEGIQADIFDHLLAALPMFDLRVFQRPSGHDFQNISR